MTTNTRPVYSDQTPIAATADGKIKVYLATSWRLFFQQFTQKAATAVDVALTGSPLTYTPNQNGNVFVSAATQILLMRGADSFNVTGQKLIPVAIGDSLQITYVGTPTIKFLGNG